MLTQQLINGITIGANYALVAVGFTMVFGVMKLINLANGSLFILGAYLSVMFYQAMSGNFLLAFVMAILVNAIIGYLIDKAALANLRKHNAPRLSGMITTLAIATILDNAIVLIYGSETKAFRHPVDFGKVMIGSAVVGKLQIYSLILIIVLVVLLTWLVYGTKFGRSMRATSQNPEAAQIMGIRVNRVISITFIISASLACIAGTMIGLYYQAIDISLAMTVGNKTFAAAVLAGVGNIPGAVLGGIVVGVVETLVAAYLSSGLRDAIAFAILIFMLLIKPTGLFGKKETTKV